MADARADGCRWLVCAGSGVSILSGLWGYVAAAVAALFGLVGVYLSGRRSGRQGAENKAMKDAQKRAERGRDAVSDLRGAGRDDRIAKLRDNDAEW